MRVDKVVNIYPADAEQQACNRTSENCGTAMPRGEAGDFDKR